MPRTHVLMPMPTVEVGEGGEGAGAFGASAAFQSKLAPQRQLMWLQPVNRKTRTLHVGHTRVCSLAHSTNAAAPSPAGPALVSRSRSRLPCRAWPPSQTRRAAQPSNHPSSRSSEAVAETMNQRPQQQRRTSRGRGRLLALDMGPPSTHRSVLVFAGQR